MKLNRANRTILLLIIYLVGVAAYAFPNYQRSGAWGEYIAIIAGSLTLFGLLWYVLKRRDNFRDKERERISKKPDNH